MCVWTGGGRNERAVAKQQCAAPDVARGDGAVSRVSTARQGAATRLARAGVSRPGSSVEHWSAGGRVVVVVGSHVVYGAPDLQPGPGE